MNGDTASNTMTSVQVFHFTECTWTTWWENNIFFFFLVFCLVVIVQELLEQGKQNLVWIQNIHIPNLLKHYSEMNIKATISWHIKPGSLVLGRWRQYDPMKCSWPSTRLYPVISQKNAGLTFTAIRMSNVMYEILIVYKQLQIWLCYKTLKLYPRYLMCAESVFK